MTDPPESPAAARSETPVPTVQTESTVKSERAARLAKALRENLRRRKAPRPARPTDS
jgi:hypothetical protein